MTAVAVAAVAVATSSAAADVAIAGACSCLHCDLCLLLPLLPPQARHPSLQRSLMTRRPPAQRQDVHCPWMTLLHSWLQTAASGW